MKVANIFGPAYSMIPDTLANPITGDQAIQKITMKRGNVLLFIDGPMPAKAELVGISNESQLRNIVQDKLLIEINDLNLTYTYNKDTKERIIRKAEVDAFDCNFIKAGTIGYFALVMYDNLESLDNSEQMIMFSDSIGSWGDTTSAVIINKVTGTPGEQNTFKDFSLILTDRSISDTQGV